MRKSLILFLFLLLSYASGVLALESTDVMETQILKAYNFNVLVVNRGLEDGIYRNDHVKLTNQNGFIARGICIKSTLLVSHFRIYRVTRPELVSKDDLYQLRSINQSRIPRDIATLKKVDFTKFFNEYNDEKMLKEIELQNKRIVKYDLPDDVVNTVAYQRKRKTGFELFVEDNFEDEDLRRDLSDTYFEIFVSPYTFESLFEQEQSNYGGRIYNFGRKYRYSLSYLQRNRRIVDPLDRTNQFETKSLNYRADFQINRITDNWSLVSFAQFDQEKFGRIYYPHKWYRVAPLGFRYHFWEDNPKDDFFHVNYSPAVDTIEYNDLTNPSSDSLTERDGFRHTFWAQLRSPLTEDLYSHFNLYYAPYADSFGSEINWGDNMLDVSTTLSYKMEEKFFFEFTLQYLRDELRGEVYNLRDDNSINTIRLRYEVAL